MFRRVLKQSGKTGEKMIATVSGNSVTSTQTTNLSLRMLPKSTATFSSLSGKSNIVGKQSSMTKIAQNSSLTSFVRPQQIRSPLLRSLTTMTSSSWKQSSWNNTMKVSTASVVLAVSLFAAQEKQSVFAEGGVNEEKLKEADRIYENESGTFTRQELLEFMQKMNRENEGEPEVLWRLARAYYEVAMLQSTAEALKNEYYETAYKIIKNAMTIDENNYKVQQWLGILLGK
eukprot:TRINITY_DN3782_c0_g1_i2.p1 TRINITY_DN3782_c0_g1~~TRINITY_DN3782_c0_g1_i2.p1  ORF type:complete len:241 (-),score=85.47 TRINITY_DN3782_c0_g1_i2:829-1518(-)